MEGAHGLVHGADQRTGDGRLTRHHGTEPGGRARQVRRGTEESGPLAPGVALQPGKIAGDGEAGIAHGRLLLEHHAAQLDEIRRGGIPGGVGDDRRPLSDYRCRIECQFAEADRVGGIPETGAPQVGPEGEWIG
jgi:hypothetical protein